MNGLDNCALWNYIISYKMVSFQTPCKIIIIWPDLINELTSSFQLFNLNLDIRLMFVSQNEGDDNNMPMAFAREVSNEARQAVEDILDTAANRCGVTSATDARTHSYAKAAGQAIVMRKDGHPSQNSPHTIIASSPSAAATKPHLHFRGDWNTDSASFKLSAD